MLRRTLLRVSTGIALRADGPIFRSAEASDKSGRYVDVRSFGAKGDGASDDATPIQLAIDHAHSNARSTVFVPEGRYLIGKTLRLRRGINLQGAGSFDTERSSNLTSATDLDGPLIATDRYFGGESSHYFMIQNLCITRSTPARLVEHPAIAFWGAFVGSSIVNVLLLGGYGPAISFEYGFDVLIDRLWIGACTTKGHAVEINRLDVGGGPIGVLDFGNVYVENVSNVLNGQPRLHRSERGRAILARNVHSLSFREIHSEACKILLSYEGDGGLLSIGKASCSFYGDGSLSSAIYVFASVPGACSLGPVVLYKPAMPLAFLAAKTDSVALSRIDAVSTFFSGIVFGRPSSGKDEIGHIFGTKIGRGPPRNGAEFVGQVYIDVVEQIGYLGLTTGFAQRDWRRMTE